MSTEVTLDPRAPLSSDEATAQSRRLRAIYEIGRQLWEQREPAQVIRTINRAIQDELGPDRLCLLSVRRDGTYSPVAASNISLDESPESWPLSHTVLRRAHETGLAVLSFDARADPGLGESSSVRTLGISSVMCVPLGSSPVRGLIYADLRGDLRAFTRGDLEFLTAVSVYASLALERAEELVSAQEALLLTNERIELLQTELLRHDIIGRSPRLLAAYDSVRRLAGAGARVLLRGETGTGKELFARAYAANCPRHGKPYVPVPIPALAPTLVESELFGHVRGAFTEAARDKKGRLELAHGGVLFLDEVGDIDLPLQAKLLRFLDSGEVYRVGDTERRSVDGLVVSATNRPVEELVEAGRFRADLVARLGHMVTLPPLRDHPEDIPLLVEHFVALFDRSPRKKVFSPEAMELLSCQPWKFNVRQLQQVVEWVVCMVDRTFVRAEDLPDSVRQSRTAPPDEVLHGEPPGDTPRPLREVVEATERAHIERVLQFTKGNKRKAIEILGVASDTFYRRLHEFGLHKKQE